MTPPVLLRAMADLVAGLQGTYLRAMSEDSTSLAFAKHFSFVEPDRQVEQLRAVEDEPEPDALPEGAEVVTADEHPELWAASYAHFGTEVLVDFAVLQPLQITEQQ
jgi:mycothiol synthase